MRGAGIVALTLWATPALAGPLPAEFVYLRDVDPSIRQDMRYATENNFTGRRLPGYQAGECVLKRTAAQALARVQADLAGRNLSLKVYDCYRPMSAVRAMARWAYGPSNGLDTTRFYPGLERNKLFALGYISNQSRHSRGAAIDLTIVRRDAPVQAVFDPARRYAACDGSATTRAPDDSLDMGTAYDCFSSKSATDSPAIAAEQRANRRILLDAMRRHHFFNYKREWWHFSYSAADTRTEYDFSITPR